MFQIIYTDIDGTLLNSAHALSPKTIAAIKKVHQKGIPVILVSARPPRAIMPFIEQLGLQCPFVSFNGALILDAGGQVLAETTIGAPDFAALERALEAFTSPISVNYYHNLDWFSRYPLDDFTLGEAEITGLKPANKPDTMTDAHKILVMGAPSVVTQLQQQLKEQFPQLAIHLSKSTYLEIAHESATKSQAVDFLCGYYGIDNTEAIAFGDNFNDLDMLKAVGCGVAMANAPEAVKAQADELTLSNDDEGFVFTIEKYF